MTGRSSGVDPPASYRGGEGLEVRIRPSPSDRLRGALSASGMMAAAMVVVGVLLWLLTGTPSWLVVLELWAILSAFLSYFGQGHNAVFVGDGGIRRVTRGLNLTAPWPALTGVAVEVPGDRIVVFKVTSSRFSIQRTGVGARRAAEAMERNAPDGFRFRLDRAGADALVRLISERRPGLPGLAEWERASRPIRS